MKMSHEEYLKRMLNNKKVELDNVVVTHQISIAVYNNKREMLTEQINSIERQLEER